MMLIIGCDNCNMSDNGLHMKLEFRHVNKFCKTCNHDETTIWNYYFCNSACMFNWLSHHDVEQKGVPCRGCRNIQSEPTGFLFGFKENGVCTSCNGVKSVK